MTKPTTNTPVNDTTELFATYAQHCVDGMDIGDLMNDQKISIVRRLEDLPQEEAIEEIEESVYADELSSALAIVNVIANADTTELFDTYAQRSVEDIDTGDLENAVKGNIEERLEDLPLVGAIEEIQESAYAEELAEKLASIAPLAA